MMTSPLLWIWPLFGVLFCHHTSAQSVYSLSGNKNSTIVFKPTWPAGSSSVYHVAFRFRTRSLNSPLFRIIQSDAGTATASHATVLRISDGHLQIVHPFSGGVELHSSPELVADNTWHTLRIAKDSSRGSAKLSLDNFPESAFRITGTPPAETENPVEYSVVFGGGPSSSAEWSAGASNSDRFHGCLQDIRFAAMSKDQSGPPPLTPISPDNQAHVKEGCEDRCVKSDPCQHGGQCFDDFDRFTCDCSQTEHEGTDCSVPESSLVTLTGANYIVFDGRHSVAAGNLYLGYSRISLDFKTVFSDGLLLSTALKGENVKEGEGTSVSVMISTGRIRVEITSGASQQVNAFNDLTSSSVNDGKWHTLSLEIRKSKITVKLDKNSKDYSILTRSPFVYFAPRLSVGASKQKNMLPSDPSNSDTNSVAKSYVGCLRRVYFGAVNLLADLRKSGRRSTSLRSLNTGIAVPVEAAYSCLDVGEKDLAVTLLSPFASVDVPATAPYKVLQLNFRLPKNNRHNPEPGTLVSGDVLTGGANGQFRISISDGVVLELTYPDQTGNVQRLQTQPIGGNLYDGNWHSLTVKWANGGARRRRQEPVALVDSKGETSPEENALSEVPSTVPAPEPEASQSESTGLVEPTIEIASEGLPSSHFESEFSTPALTEAELSSESVTTDFASAEVNPNLRVAAPAPNYLIRLEIDSETGGLNLPSESPALKPSNLVRIGHDKNGKGILACLRNIKLDGQQWDVRRAMDGRNPDISIDTCNNQASCEASNPCEHGAACVNGIAGPVCLCGNSGYLGKTCHLPLYTQTCADLYLAGERRSGVHIIDLDGSGPLKPAYVHCNMSIQEQRGTTVIGHNFLANTEMKNGANGGRRYDIQYRQFDKESLKALLDVSKQCRQFISYRCKGAPLKLGSHTWFHSVADIGNITSLGSDTQMQCSCRAMQGIVCALDSKKDLICNCDADDDVERVDEGFYMSKENVGITNMTFVNRNIKGAGFMTLGPLECTNNEKAERTIALLSHEAHLALTTLAPDEDISFFFRTAQKQALLLYQPAGPSFFSSEEAEIAAPVNSLRLAVTNATTVTLYLSVNGEIEELPVVTSKPINNAAWHLIKVEFGPSEVRLTVDLNSNYLSWNPADSSGEYEGPLFVGGAPPSSQEQFLEPGLIGCIQGFVRGTQSVDLIAISETSSFGSTDIRRECQSSCSPNPCQNRGECFDKFGEYECICANPVAHSGKHCEININENPVTFVNASGAAYIYFKLIPSDPLKESISLSFRTHRPSGVLLYSHDNFNNFVQLHLDSSNRVILTFNLEKSIRNLQVKRDGLSDGRWHQVHVSRSSSGIVLSVDFDHSDSLEIAEGHSLLAKYSSRPWERGSAQLESVVPPRPFHEISPFKDLYIGGLAKPQLTSTLPGFYGCVRGLKIGDHLVDLMGEAESERELGVVQGCEASCEKENPCKYGGLCINQWGDSTESTECDCRNTSFVGKTCSEDIGAHFDGSSQLIVEYKPGRATAFDISRPLNFRFAFSTATAPGGKAALLFAQFYEKLVELVVGLSEGEVSAELYFTEGDEPKTVVRRSVKGNFTQGARHAVVLSVHPTSVSLQVDEAKQESSLPFLPVPAFVHFVTVGDIDATAVPVKRQELTAYEAFVGCITNVKIEVQDAGVDSLQPLRAAVRRESAAFVSTRTKGVLAEGQCAAPLALPPTQSPFEESNTGLSFPAWDMLAAAPVELTIEEPQPIPTPAPTARNTGMIVGIICGIFLLLVLIAVIIYVLRMNKNKKKNYSPNDKKNALKDDAGDNVDEALLQPSIRDPNFYEKPKVQPISPSFDRPVSKFIDDAILPSSRSNLAANGVNSYSPNVNRTVPTTFPEEEETIPLRSQ